MLPEALVVDGFPILPYQDAAAGVGTRFQTTASDAVDALQDVGFHAVVIGQYLCVSLALADIHAFASREEPPCAHRETSVGIRLGKEHPRDVALHVRLISVRQHHGIGLGEGGRHQRKQTIGGEKRIYQRGAEIQAFEKSHVSIAHIVNPGDADHHTAIRRQLLPHGLLLFGRGIPRQAEAIHAFMPLHCRNKSGVNLSRPHAEQGDATPIGSGRKRYDVEIVVHHGDGCPAQGGSQLLRLGGADALLHVFQRDFLWLTAQPEAVFPRQHPTAVRVHIGFGEGALADGVHHLVHGFRGVILHQKHIVARADGFSEIAGHVRHAFHIQRVGEYQALEAHLVLQEASNDGSRQAGRQEAVPLHSRHLEVAHHHATQTCADILAERKQLHAVQALAVMPQDGERLVRIRVGVAMSGEMLGDGKDTLALQSSRVGHHLGGHLAGVFAKGADVDDRIQRIGIGVGHGSKIDVHAQLAQLAPYLASVGFDEGIVFDAAQGGIAGKGRSVGEAHGQSPLAVHRHQQRHLGVLLRQIGEGSLPVDGAFPEEEAANLVLAHPLLQTFTGGFVGHGRHAGDEQLPHLLLEAEARHDRIHPRGTTGFVRGQARRGFLLCLRGRDDAGHHAQEAGGYKQVFLHTNK